MKASDKVTTLNAYVTGFGASKRVVVWDTSIAKGTPDEISFIFGHEMGHYVLNHIPKTLVFLGVLLLVLFYLGYRIVEWLLARYGAAWRVPSQNDWGMLAVFMLVVSVLGFIANPITNGYSRGHEHEADVYGQEAVHGIVADPQKVAQDSFQLLGENGLSNPYPSELEVYWLYSHPPIGLRAGFSKAYDPWAAGEAPKFFNK
jgi:Zn-dependent protease with chaperone function